MLSDKAIRAWFLQVKTAWHLTTSYFSTLRIINSLPVELIQPEALFSRYASGKSFSIRVPTEPRRIYNTAIASLRTQVKRSHPPSDTPFSTLMLLFLAIRLIAVASAIANPSALLRTVGILALQFIIMPYSLFVSLTQAVALSTVMYIAHFIGFAPLQAFMACVFPDTNDRLSFTVTVPFIVSFMAIDQLLCALTLVWLPNGHRPAKRSMRRILQSVVFGFINCKTYILLILILSKGFKVNMLIWGLDAFFGITRGLGRWFCYSLMHWAPLFYNQHRISHLPHVYEHAHKFHHYLHDSTAFDAHIYGSGAPEEFFTLMMELLPAAFLGVPPPFLNPQILYWTWTNKIGHSRSTVEGEGVNAHCDHHTYHNKNFGIFSACLDMYMGTAVYNDKYEGPGYRIDRRDESDDVVVFDFTPLREAVATAS